MSKVLPLCIISGDDEFLRKRFFQGYLSFLRGLGWEVENADAAIAGQVEETLSGGVFLQAEKLAVVVHNPHQGDYTSYLEIQDPGICLILYYEGIPKGNTKWGKFVKEQEKISRSFASPPDWDLPAHAAKFVAQEVLDQGKKFSHPSLPSAIVEKVGCDLGVLYYEVLKMVLLSEGPEVSVEDVKASITEIAEASVNSITEALSVRNQKRLAKALAKVYATSPTDPTMKVCRMLAPKVLTWFRGGCLINIPPNEAAVELGLNPWYYQNKVLPAVKLWSKDALKLVQALAEGERAVLSGVVSPWGVLCAKLLGVV